MRFAERRATSFDGCPAETILFLRKPSVVTGNYEAMKTLVSQLIHDSTDGSCQRVPGGKYIWKNVASDRVVSFLEKYQGYPAANRVRPEYLRRYIDKQNTRGMLSKWTVFLGQGELSEEAARTVCQKVLGYGRNFRLTRQGAQ